MAHQIIRDCSLCGYAGSTACPNNRANCPKGLYKSEEQRLADALRELIPALYNVFLRRCQDNTNLRIVLVIPGQKTHDVGAVPDGTPIEVMNQMIRAYLRGLERGKHEGEAAMQRKLAGILGYTLAEGREYD